MKTLAHISSLMNKDLMLQETFMINLKYDVDEFTYFRFSFITLLNYFML